jgi:hypothetical protein
LFSFLNILYAVRQIEARPLFNEQSQFYFLEASPKHMHICKICQTPTDPMLSIEMRKNIFLMAGLGRLLPHAKTEIKEPANTLKLE